MDPFVFAAVLAAAFMHAGWNACLKGGGDRFSSILVLSLVSGFLGVLLLPFFPAPVAPAYPWIAASAALHTGYKLFLARAYEHGDMSQVYPIARGTAPLLVAVVGGVALGEALPAPKIVAILAISLGIIAMAFARSGLALAPRALAYALVTAGFTASYTLVDGVGARLAATASGYILWLQIVDAALMSAIALASRGPSAFRRLVPSLPLAVPAGLMSMGAYWVVIWAFTQAPIALVAALRETSVLFAMLFGMALFGERVTGARWAAAALILAGLAAMQIR